MCRDLRRRGDHDMSLPWLCRFKFPFIVIFNFLLVQSRGISSMKNIHGFDNSFLKSPSWLFATVSSQCEIANNNYNDFAITVYFSFPRGIFPLRRILVQERLTMQTNVTMFENKFSLWWINGCLIQKWNLPVHEQGYLKHKEIVRYFYIYSWRKSILSTEVCANDY